MRPTHAYLVSRVALHPDGFGMASALILSSERHTHALTGVALRPGIAWRSHSTDCAVVMVNIIAATVHAVENRRRKQTDH